MTHASTTSQRSRAGLTLVELLVVITIIILLVGLITVGYTSIIAGARGAQNTAVVNALGQGVESFRSDFGGRTPPLVTRPPGGAAVSAGFNSREFVVPDMFDSITDRAREIRDARYYSEWTLGIYLLGNSDVNGDRQTTYSTPGNEQPNLDDGHDGPGFRDPGPILAWKRRDRSTNGLWEHIPSQTGRVYGPYLESGFDEFVETVDLNGSPVQRFVDSYGNPIRFYSGYLTIDPDDTTKNVKDSFYMPPELMSEDAATELINAFPFDTTDGEFLQRFNAKNREVLTADYVILAANDNPDNWSSDSGPVRPYGDVTIMGSGEARSINLQDIDTVNGPVYGPWSPGTLNGPGRIGFENYRDMIKTNVRYTP
ncbi:MAG: hypothetical protein Tsb0013_05520 [Phycisphaerales bacterium]